MKTCSYSTCNEFEKAKYVPYVASTNTLRYSVGLVYFSAFYDSNQHSLDANSSAGIIVPSHRLQSTTSMASDYANDSDYETSELGTPKHGRDNYSELSLENETKTSDQEKFFWRSKHSSVNNSGLDKDEATHNRSKVAFHPVDEMEPSSEPGHHRQGAHLRRLSTESVGSDVSSLRASELSKQYSLGDNSLDLLEGAEITRNMDNIAESDLQFPKDVLVALPSDQRNKMNRVLTTLRRRLVAAKTDMEDLIARLNQELAVRQYLTTKVFPVPILFHHNVVPTHYWNIVFVSQLFNPL